MSVGDKLKHLDDLYAANRIDDAEQYLLGEIRNPGNSLLVRISLNNELMGIYRNKGNRKACMDQVSRQIAWMKEAEGQLDPVSEATLYLNIANAYQAFDMLEEAYDILCMVEEKYKANPDREEFHLASLYNNKAVVLIKLNDLDQAEVYFKMALKILKTLREAEDEIAVTYQNLANIYGSKGKYSLALDTARKGLDLLAGIGMEISYHSGAIANSMAMIYHRMGDEVNALKYFEKAANIILQVYGDCALYRSILESAETVRKLI